MGITSPKTSTDDQAPAKNRVMQQGYKSYWAGLYYHQQRSKGCSHQTAVRALAFKWIRVLYRCWKPRTPYDETRYLKALQERGSPLLKTAEAA
jgi:hypothetical protein